MGCLCGAIYVTGWFNEDADAYTAEPFSISVSRWGEFVPNAPLLISSLGCLRTSSGSRVASLREIVEDGDL